MRACDKKTDFLAESFKGSSLSLSPAAPPVLLDAPFFLFFLFFFYAQPRDQTPAESRLSVPASPVASWEEEWKLSAGQQSYSKFCLWRDSVP